MKVTVARVAKKRGDLGTEVARAMDEVWDGKKVHKVVHWLSEPVYQHDGGLWRVSWEAEIR